MSSYHDPVLSAAMTIATVVFVLLSVIVCRDRASRQGFSGLIFGTLGFFLGLAAIPYTFLVTRDRTLSDRDLDRAMSGAGGSVAPGEGRLAAVCDLPREQAADYLAWEATYKAIRLSIVLLVPVLALGSLWLLQSLVGGILPTFVQLYEGMSLQLPLPTQVLIACTKGLRNPSGQALLGLAWLGVPAVGFLFTVAAGYRFPVLGAIWRRTDRLWILHCMQVSAQGWRDLVPGEVLTRIGSDALKRLDLPESIPAEELPGWLRRERELLSAALWMLFPALLPIGGIAAAAVAFVCLALLLPLYTLLGNLS